ncbi:MAG: peptidylprolyl isomerase, partial [Thermodesulfobacteriota bacterium]
FVITSSRDSISVADFWAQMEKEKAFRAQFRFPERALDELRQWVLGNIISQTLISWEALDRHYEEREPLKPLYEFYRRHRLAKEFEKRFVGDKAALTDEEVKKYFEENRARFQTPEMIHYALIEGEKGFVEKLWDQLAKGHDFFAVAKAALPSGAPVQQVPVNHVGKELLAVIDGLKKGEMSRPFAYNDGMAVVKLIDRKDPAPIAFEQLEQLLRQQLGEEKYRRLKKELLETLRARSEIRMNEEEWQKVRRELEESAQEKKNS